MIRYREFVGGWKDTKTDFYSNGSPNNDLENEFKRDSWRRSDMAARSSMVHGECPTMLTEHTRLVGIQIQENLNKFMGDFDKKGHYTTTHL